MAVGWCEWRLDGVNGGERLGKKVDRGFSVVRPFRHGGNRSLLNAGAASETRPNLNAHLQSH